MRCGTKTRRLIVLKFYKESNWTQEPLLLIRSLSPRIILKAYSLDSFRVTRHWREGRVLNWNSGLSKKLHHQCGTLQDAFPSGNINKSISLLLISWNAFIKRNSLHLILTRMVKNDELGFVFLHCLYEPMGLNIFNVFHFIDLILLKLKLSHFSVCGSLFSS